MTVDVLPACPSLSGRLLRAAAASLALALCAVPAAGQFSVWRVSDGRLDLRFIQAGLSGSGLELKDVLETGPFAGEMPGATVDSPALSLAVDATSDLKFLVGDNGDYVPYGLLDGRVHVVGGFVLSSPSTGRSVSFHDMAFGPTIVRNDGPGGAPDPDYIYLGSAAEGASGLETVVRAAKIHFDIEGDGYAPGPDHTFPTVTIMAWDFWVTDELAAKLARPDLVGQLLGRGEIVARAEAWDGPWSYPPGQNVWTPYGGSPPATDAGAGDATGADVKLGALSGINSLVHSGTFPDGRNSFSMSTTSCNVGTVGVPWQAPMAENHPGIAMQLYREMDGRFEQVGVSWMKHGFFSTNTSVCNACQGGTGSLLGLNCSDTYGTTNNSDPKYLGPRSEWNAFTAHWTCLGSFFDGVPVDCVRSENGTSFNGKVDHRLEAFDADLGLPGANYYYEAMYMVGGDVDLSNNIGSRQCNLSWGGTKWTVSTTSGSSLLQGPAIQRWGDVHTTAGLAPDDGNVIVAAKATDLGGGSWRYEYAVFNWNLDRKVRSFSVPTGGGAVSALSFHDIDAEPSNDWVAAVSGGNLTWTFPDVVLPGVKVAGALEFGYLYNFGFTSTLAPGTRNAALAPHEDGPGGDLFGAATLAPAGLNLTASALAPVVGVPFDVQMAGGTANMMLAVNAVNGIPLPGPVLIGPVPFVAGEAALTLSVPPEASGLSVSILGGDVTTGPLALLGLANVLTLEIR